MFVQGEYGHRVCADPRISYSDSVAHPDPASYLAYQESMTVAPFTWRSRFLGALLALAPGACSQGGHDLVGPSERVAAAPSRWTVFTTQEDLVNPCNGEVIHLTTTFQVSTTYFASGREVNRFSARGTGFGDRGTRYTTHVVARATATGDERENNIGTEHVDGSTPGSSFTNLLRVFAFFDGAGAQHAMLRSHVRCH
jgi:hypothetical protein